jgi:hypothetical protein
MMVILYHICWYFFSFYLILCGLTPIYYSNFIRDFRYLYDICSKRHLVERNLRVISLSLHFLSIYLIL